MKVIIELFSFSGISGWGTDLDYCDIEWFALEMNRDHSVILKLHPNTVIQTLLLTMRATPHLTGSSLFSFDFKNNPLVLENQVCQCRRHKRGRFDPSVRKIPWRMAWQPTPVFLPGESHGQRSLVGYSPQGHKESDTTEVT